MDWRTEPMQAADWPEVERIYLQGISTGIATFETESPGWDKWDAIHHRHSRWVVRDEGALIGWAALSPVSGRAAYAGVAEVSVYVADTHRQQGVGRSLLWTLISSAEKNGIWMLQAGIFPENQASIRLHTRFGFREVGIRERVAELHGRWKDVTLLERRSALIGVG
ncbi:MAG: N-acetyltransferase [Acidobacteriales bacterium]|nr:N-acetyltransferase [Terriglobales bacterium]